MRRSLNAILLVLIGVFFGNTLREPATSSRAAEKAPRAPTASNHGLVSDVGILRDAVAAVYRCSNSKKVVVDEKEYDVEVTNDNGYRLFELFKEGEESNRYSVQVGDIILVRVSFHATSVDPDGAAWTIETTGTCGLHDIDGARTTTAVGGTSWRLNSRVARFRCIKEGSFNLALVFKPSQGRSGKLRVGNLIVETETRLNETIYKKLKDEWNLQE